MYKTMSIVIYIYVCVCVCAHTYRDQTVSVLLQVSHPVEWSQHSVHLSQCAEDVILTTRLNVEQTCKFIFFIYSMSTSPKNSYY